MKKIISVVLFLIGLYIILIFTAPSISSSIWDKLWLIWFNQKIISLRDEFNKFIVNYDFIWKYNDTKNKVLEIKQNVETQVDDTKKKIEVIQTNVDKTTKSVNNTTKAINDTMNSLNELQNSVVDIIPSSTY